MPKSSNRNGIAARPAGSAPETEHRPSGRAGRRFTTCRDKLPDVK